MLSRLAGALLRAVLVVLILTLPAMLVPSVSADTAQIVALIAIFAAALTFFEYASVYPGLIEFRDAPPFNRIRFLSLLAIVLLLSLSAQARIAPTTLTQLIEALGSAVGRMMDFPYSPIRLLRLTLPTDASFNQVTLLRAAAGLSFCISTIMLVAFYCAMRIGGWPTGRGSFNVWVNLPTFDPTAGGDVIERLRRDALYNISLGILLPFVIPATIKAISVGITDIAPQSAHTMIWVVTAWSFIPASLFMRGMAINRIAQMIEDKRRTTDADPYMSAHSA
ncbi:hypothetical protein BFP70_12320 [Thioclava sp. SK-1]|uniref:hypothetical protein n=1 Tax=Thioclava sp. SK-1 TaxID=1889770 RepID=UPI0008254C25|nr:hypothetical protein [Thioclava sp. SK-1]OCX63429.1 hypothetical protein BFP70_12320 [Thioclava sp. SK-1]